MSGNRGKMICTVLAMTAPLAHYGGLGYMAVLLAAGAMLPLTVLAGDGLSRVSKPLAALELIWLGIAMGSLMNVAGANWPGEKSELVVPLTLLGMAAITGNREKGERACCTLFWIMLLPTIWVVTVLAGKAEPRWLIPQPQPWSGTLIAVLLYPSVIGITNGTDIKTGIAVALISGSLAAILQGGLGLTQATMEGSPLYELGRCVGKGGFEIIISVVLTVSWYGFACLGMNASEIFGEKVGLRKRESRIITGLFAGVLLLAPDKITDLVLICGALILWVLVPILHLKK